MLDNTLKHTKTVRNLIRTNTGAAILLSLAVLDNVQIGSSFNCYSCSYTRASDPSVNYDCVTTPQNFTVGQVTLACTAPYQCVTKALYNQGMTHIRSVTRSCQAQQDICSGTKCCNEAGVYPSCEYKCRDELCNDNNPEEHFRSLSSPTPPGGGAESSVVPCGWLTLFAVLALSH